ncbi:WD repeat-containing protein 90 [Rhincodon typus]|uniref:WD repeat-containing protein 90 n=1 Tax=Rhincodon typus TaxID=259920 RepID=UPI00203071CF|nr:WD repeat-containing protein 90 [Rhincodon typus]
MSTLISWEYRNKDHLLRETLISMDKPKIESAWQRPYVNIFKHFKLEEWKKSTKEGDVTGVMDKTLKCTVYRIRGPIPPANYIQLPKTSTQSLGLVGRYLYLLFKPIVSKYFVVHFDAVTEGSQVIRISFSNLFKEFKSTATWLQFPFVCSAVEGSVYNATAKTAKQDLVGLAPPGVKWTCLMMDLEYLLSFYLNRHYSHLKSIKLCSNMFVKNIFTSDLVFEPSVTAFKAKRAGLVLHDVSPVPREMAFLVPKGETWHDIYDYIRFPSDGVKMPFDSIQKGQSSPHKKDHPTHCTPVRANPPTVSVSKAVQDRVSLIQQITSPKTVPCRRWRSSQIITNIPKVHLDTTVLPHCDKEIRESGDEATAISDESAKLIPVDDGGIHVFAGQSGRVSVEKCSGDTEEVVCTKVPTPTRFICQKFKDHKGLQPDPILKLKRIIGFGGCTMKCAAWNKSGSAVAYPCHAIVVVMEIDTGQQRFFIGHTDKVSALSFNGTSTLLASAQTGNVSLVRIWNFNKGNCLAMFKTHVHSVLSLSFSFSGRVLCGVGKDSRGKSMVVVWDTAKVSRDGEVVVLAKAHTEVDIQVMKIAVFDDTRMVSCGRDNIRLWRVRSGALRSCPVNLGEYHCLEFTDVAFEEGHLADKDPADRMLFACSKSGHIIEIDYKNVVIKNARRLFPSQQKHSHQRETVTFNSGAGIAINSISVSAAFCATGSDDGYLRLWPLDFSTVFLEAEHEGGVSFVSIDPNGLKVLAATTAGNLGYLDIPSRGYTTLMRSHTNKILAFSVDGIRRHLVTVSEDCTIRVWDLDSMQQLYDFVSAEETPCAVTFHPTQQIFACGFSSGVVRIFNVGNSSLLAEQRQHRGKVIGLVFSPNGEYMYSAGSLGSLALYNATEEGHHVIRILGNVVARGSYHGPDALTVSSDSRYLAFVGPSEYIVTVMDAHSLDEIMLIDVSILDLETTTLDTALKVCYSSAAINQLLVTTSSNKILWLNAKTGKLIREVCNIHKTVSTSLAVSEDIQYLLTAGEKVIKVWDYHMKQDINFQDLASASGNQNKTGCSIFIWNVAGGCCKTVLCQHTTEVQAMAYSRDDRLFMSAGDYRDLTIALWDTRKYELLSTTRISNPLHDLAFDPTAVNEFACVGVGGVHFWLVEQTGNEVQLKVHRVSIPDEVGADELTALCYNSDSVLYTATNTGKICAWDTQQNRCFMTWDADEGEIGIVQSRRYRLMTGSNTKKIRLWAVAAVQEMRLEGTRARSNSVLLEHEMILDGTIVSAVFDDIMNMGIVGTTAGTLWYINWAENTSIRLISGHRNKVNQVTFSPDESHFATCAEDGSLRVWVMHTTELVVQFHVLNQSCLCMAWSPVVHSRKCADKQQIVAGYSDGTIRFFGILKTEMELKIHPHPVAVSAIAYSMDGEVIISGGKDGLMAVSSSRTGITIRVISDHKGSPITAIECTRKKYDEFGLDGCEMWLAVSSDRRVSVWATDWHKDQCELIDWLTFPAPIKSELCDKSTLPPSLAAFSRSQSGIVVYVGFGAKPEIILYNLYKKQTIKKIPLPQWATSMSPSPGGQFIAIGTNGRLLKLIQYPCGKFQDFAGHNDIVHFSQFTPSGKFLLSVAYNEVLVWEVQNLHSNHTHIHYL